MTTIEIPALRITSARFALISQRGHSAETESECVLDALLLALAAAANPGHGSTLTKPEIAELVERATRTGHEMAEQAGVAHAAIICACGDDWFDHLTACGCLVCGCTARRPHAAQLAPVLVPAGGEPR